MNLVVKAYPQKPFAAQVLAVFLTNNKTDNFAGLPQALKDYAKRFFDDFKRNKLKQDILLPVSHISPDIEYLYIGFPELIKLYDDFDRMRIMATRLLDACQPLSLDKIALCLSQEECRRFIPAVLDGFLLGSYSFKKYKKDKLPFDPSIELYVAKSFLAKTQTLLKERSVIAASVNRCRDLVNEPGDVATPQTFAQWAQDIARANRLTCEILTQKDLAKQGYTGLIAVGRGAVNPPLLITLKYKTRSSKKHIIFIGKGITFDTGGISIKPANEMWEMKGDMSGGAAVLLAMEAIGKLGSPVNVTGIIAVAENAVGSRAQKPGNIITAKNGKTIHVDNTDAEGRIVLTDAFARAEKEKADYIIDMATLTGACARALGPELAGVMGNTPSLVKAIIRAGQDEGEGYWELPLLPIYRKMIETPCADVNNVGGSSAGAITAGLFLQEFIPQNAHWAHCDIAGTFLRTKGEKYFKAGATGFGVKTFVELARNFKKYLR